MNFLYGRANSGGGKVERTSVRNFCYPSLLTFANFGIVWLLITPYRVRSRDLFEFWYSNEKLKHDILYTLKCR